MNSKQIVSIIFVSIILFSMVFASRSWTGFLLTFHGREIIDTSAPGEEAEEYAIEDHVSEESVEEVEEPVIAPSSGTSRGSLRNLLTGLFGSNNFRGPGVASNGDGSEGGSTSMSSGGVCGTGPGELCEGFTDSARTSEYIGCSNFDNYCDEDKIYHGCVNKGQAEGFKSDDVCVCYNTFDCNDYGMENPAASKWRCDYKVGDVVCIGSASANALGVISKQACGCDDTECAKDTTMSNAFFGGEHLCLYAKFEKGCKRGPMDSRGGQCARVNVERAFGRSFLSKIEIGGEAACEDGVSVYALYEGFEPEDTRWWDPIASKMDGDDKIVIGNDYEEKGGGFWTPPDDVIFGLEWKKVKYVDICARRSVTRGCNYHLQYVIFDVVKNPLEEPPAFALETMEFCANSEGLISKVGKDQYKNSCSKDKTIDGDCVSDAGNFDSLSLDDSLCLAKPSGKLRYKLFSSWFKRANQRARDKELGQCARIDLTKLGHGPIKVESLEMRVLSDGCHDDLDVYACYAGRDCDSRKGWTRIANNLNGGSPNPLKMSAEEIPIDEQEINLPVLGYFTHKVKGKFYTIMLLEVAFDEEIGGGMVVLYVRTEDGQKTAFKLATNDEGRTVDDLYVSVKSVARSYATDVKGSATLSVGGYKLAGASPFGDARVQYVDVCVDHTNGCNHKLDWVKVKVAY